MNCRSCNGEKLELILDLGNQPWCNDFLSEERIGKEEKYPLRLNYCHDCELLQLDHTVPKETMFSDHCYLSGMTKTLINHFYDVAKENVEQFNIKRKDLVVDIGGNDGTQLLQYKKAGIKNVLNVECAERVSEISKKNKIKTITEYFNRACVEKHIGEKTVKLYNASGVFFHLEELHSVIDGIKYSLRDDGVLIVQFMYAGTMIEKLNFDTIYHEHLCYYTLRSLNNLLRPYGLEMFDAYYSEIHSGSIIAKITHTNGVLNKPTVRYSQLLEKDSHYTLDAFKSFATTIKQQKNDLRIVLESYKKENKTIYAYGAPAKGNTLLNYFGIDNTLVDKAVEINELKIGNYLPQSHIPITKEDKKDLPDYYLLLSHNFAEELIKKNTDIIEKGVKFIVPFPQIEIVEKKKMKILITGATGFLGRHLCPKLKALGYELYISNSTKVNLLQYDNLRIYDSHKFDYIFHLAAVTKAGDYCLKHQGDQWLYNQTINTNILTYWKVQQPQAKMICMGTSCSYSPELPMVESNYLLGPPEKSLYTYAMTKRMLLVGLQSIEQQYGLDWLYFVPSTLYGPDFELQDNHFIFDFIRNCYNAKYNEDKFVVWGDGEQRRELIYVDDAIDIMIKLMKEKNEIFNLGTGQDYTINEFAQEVCKIYNYDFNLVEHDMSKYIGVREKKIDIDKVSCYLDNKATQTLLSSGLHRCIEYFKRNYEK